MTHLLYIEDELEIGQWVMQRLLDHGYQVTWLKSGEDMDRHLPSADLVILDVMLPGLDGFSLGKRTKREYAAVPILMLSARSAVEDKLEGLSFADDYLTKPFHPDELIARIEVLLRRFNRKEDTLQLHHLLVYTKDMRIVIRESGGEIQLTGKQYHIFQMTIRGIGYRVKG